MLAFTTGMFLLIACSNPADPSIHNQPPGAQDSDSAPLDTEPDLLLSDDGAAMVVHTLPADMSCGAEVAVEVVVHNTGTTTWTRDEGFKLGMVEDEDPFYGPDTRIWLDEEEIIPPGGAHAFRFTLSAPEHEASYRTDWRMVHEGVHWFGESVSQDVSVSCEDPDPEGLPPLDQVVWLHHDVSGWPEASTLHTVTLSSDQICLDYDAADLWPVVDIGVDVVANPWILLEHEGTWYAATWEWLRPGQTCKSLAAVDGSHIKQPPLQDWSPKSGEHYWFMVSGLARSSERNAEERTNLVEVVWP